MRTSRGEGIGLVLIAITSIQLGAALSTELFDEVGSAGTVLLRTLFAAIILMAIVRPAREALTRRSVRDIALYGITLAGMNLPFFAALERLPLGIAVTLEFVGPLAVAIWASRRPRDLIWVALAAGGVLLFAPDLGNGLDPVGVVLALIAGCFWGAYILVSARVGRGPAGLGGLSYAMAFAVLLVLPFGLPSGGTDLLDAHVIAVGLAIALLSSVLPYAAELTALRRIPEGTFGILLSLEPAVAALFGTLLLNQHLVARELVAIALVVVASAGALSAPEVNEPPQV